MQKGRAAHLHFMIVLYVLVASQVAWRSERLIPHAPAKQEDIDNQH